MAAYHDALDVLTIQKIGEYSNAATIKLLSLERNMYMATAMTLEASKSESKIEQNIFDITNQGAQNDGEDRQKYLRRLMRAVDKLPDRVGAEGYKEGDATWDQLDGATQEWAVSNAKLSKDNPKAPFNDFPDLPVKATADDEQEDINDVIRPARPKLIDPGVGKIEAKPDAPEAKKEKAKKKTVKAAKVEENEKAEDPKEAADAAPSGRKPGGTVFLIEETIKNPTAKLVDLVKKTRNAGYTITDKSAVACYYGTISRLKILSKLGMLKEAK